MSPFHIAFVTGIFLGCATALTAQPSNDNFSSRIPLTGTRVSVTGLNTGATREPGEPGEGTVQQPPILHTVWWSWTAPAEGVMVASVIGSEFPAVLDIHTGGALQNLISVSEYPQNGPPRTRARVAVTAGTTYQIVVGSEYETTGKITLNLAFIDRPPNDNFADRIDLGSTNVSTSGTNTAATMEAGEPNLESPFFSRTIWWSWMAPASGPVTIGLEAGPFSPKDALFTSDPNIATGLGVFIGSTLNTLVSVTNQNVYGLGTASIMNQVTFDAVAGTVYEIAADGNVGPLGNLRVRVARTLPPLVILTGPVNNSEFIAGDSVVAAAEAFDPDGTVAGVEFCLQDQFGRNHAATTVYAPPFRAEWPSLAPGRYQLMARATDDLGAKADAIPVSFDVRPANDDFARRATFSGSFVTVTGTLANASSEPGEPSGIGAANVWWSWTAPASGTFTITAISAPGYYPTLSVFTGGSLSNLTLINTSTFGGFGTIYSTRVVITAEAGMAYAIAVGTGGYGDWCTLSVAQTVPPTVAITSPTNNSRFVVGDAVTFEADAQDTEGTVRRVEFILDDYLQLGVATNSPFKLKTTFREGNLQHRVRAWATDDAGVSTPSDPVWFEVSYPGPSNDNFADRIDFTGASVTVTGTTANATFEAGETSYVSPGSIWWAWAAPESGDFTLTVKSDPGTSPSMAVFTGSTLATLNLITNNAFQGFDRTYSTRVVLQAQAGTVYPIAVGSSGSVTLTVTESLPPSVWFTSPINDASFLAGETINLVADATDPEGTVSKIEFYHSNGARVLGVATNRPFTLALSTTNLFAGYNSIQALATDNHGLTTVSTNINIIVAYPGPPNDNFADRIDFTGSSVTVTGTTANATFEAGETSYVSPRSIWWAWTAPESGDFTLTVKSDPGYWPSLAVFTGSTLATLNLVTNNAFQGLDRTYSTRVVLQAQAGTVYPIAVGSWGNVTLTATKSLPPSVWITSPTNDAVLLVGETINLAADAIDPDGAVNKVEFYHVNGARVLGAVTNRPFILPLNATNLLVGYNWVQALATDDRGLTTASSEVRLVVNYAPPPNDKFSDRISLTGMFLVTPADTRSATLEPGEPISALGPGAGSVWWSWTAPASGKVTLACSRDHALLGVYVGSSVASLVAIATNATYGDSPAQLTFEAFSGVEYEIALVCQSGAIGPAQLSLFQDARELQGPSLRANGTFAFRLISAPGRTWIIETGTDLIQWSPVATGYCASGVLEFLDRNAASYPRRFYRAVVGP